MSYSLFDLPGVRPAPIAPPRPAPLQSAQVNDCAGVVSLLEHAQARGLKFPKLWLQLPDRSPLRVTIAGERSRTPGYLMLTDGRPFGENTYYGRISPRGVLEWGRDATEERRGQLAPLLARLAAEPAKVAAEYGHLTGQCCFCARVLNDERSTAVGYGPICAEKFGLPWGQP